MSINNTNIVDFTELHKLLSDREELIKNGPINEVIELAKELGYNHPLGGAYINSLKPLFNERFDKENIDKETI